MAAFNKYVEAEVKIDVTPQEILHTCSDRECQTLANLLFANGFYPNGDDQAYQNESYFSGITSYGEQELAKALAEIWRARNLMTQSQAERIYEITKEAYV